ncbi:MAG TPA: META domain-containing protein [Arachidicoccus sp.]|nr:META domain-containing protein [Arachidicoccus sp.]
MKNIFLLAVVVVLLFSACGTTKNIASEKQALQHTWVLTKGGRDQMGCNVQKPLSLTFTDKGVNGYSGCNNYFGPFKLSKNHHLKLGPLASTMMACVGEDCGKVEVGFIRSLDQVDKYKISGNTLLLYLDNQLLLTLRKAD